MMSCLLIFLFNDLYFFLPHRRQDFEQQSPGPSSRVLMGHIPSKVGWLRMKTGCRGDMDTLSKRYPGTSMCQFLN